MEIDDIKDPKLMELVSAGLKSDCTITNDLEDALENSNDDEELIMNWKNSLLSLYELTQHFYRELGGIESQQPIKPDSAGIGKEEQKTGGI